MCSCFRRDTTIVFDCGSSGSLQIKEDIMKNMFRKLAALSLTAITILTGCGAYMDAADEPQEPTYSTLQVYTDSEEETAEADVRSVEADTTASEVQTKQTTASARNTTAANTKKTKAAKTTAKPAKTTAVRTTAAPVTTAANKEYVEYHFRSKKYLQQHFEKHGGEFKDDFGYKTEKEYEQGASDVINDSDALHKTEKEDGDDIYYIEDTNEFVVLAKDGYIRTYFRPDAGKKYYDKQ